MRTTTIACVLGIVLALASVSRAYQVEVINEPGMYTLMYDTYGNAHTLSAYAYYDVSAAGCSNTHMILARNEYGYGAAVRDGYTTVRITSYDPEVDPPIHLYYQWQVGAHVSMGLYTHPGTLPAGSGFGQAHAMFNPGNYRADASASYTGTEVLDVDGCTAENSVDLSWEGAWYELYGFAYVDLDLSVQNAVDDLEGWSVADVRYLVWEMHENGA